MKFIHEPVQSRHFDSTNLNELMMFRKAFDFESLDVNSVQGELKEAFDEAEDKTPDNLLKIQVDFTFRMLPRFYKPDRAKGWNSVLRFEIDNLGAYTIIIDGRNARAEKGSAGSPTCTVKTDVTSLATQLALIRIEDVRLDDELSDADLEMVAGGKAGACGTEISAGTACGADYSGLGVAGGTACGGAACLAAGGVGAACGGDACGAAGGAIAGCVAAACGGAACGADIGGGSGCGAAACAAAVCGAAACLADACLGAACGAAVGIGACAGNVCVVDIRGLADEGPCAVNVCPGVPGI